MSICNPVLKGFNPDPSFLRVGKDYYLATSTFEWYPGVQIHHSRDLENWTLVARPLNRAALLDMRGNPDSCGIWAPCLSYSDGLFWLVYTDVKRLDGAFKDSPNYITTCQSIDGEWSDPMYVNNSGFDPTLFHDDDGRKYFANIQWNHRGSGTGGNPTHDSFDGILLQEWSQERGLIGDVFNIYGGSERGLTEAPHLFKRNGWYYLTVAEGGTGYQHAVTMARSKVLTGPYETQPDGHLLCADGQPEHPIQRTGHGQYVETHWGDIYHSFLMGRPISDRPAPGSPASKYFCPLGRESGLERCVWKDDDWLYLEHGGQLARQSVPSPGTSIDYLANKNTEKKVNGEESLIDAAIHYDFSESTLPIDFQWLRTPYPERLFRLGDSSLIVTGRESIGSWFEQSLIARRQQHHCYQADTEVDFSPTTYQQAAGLTTYYNRYKFHALLLTHEPGMGHCLTIISCAGDYPDGALVFPMPQPISISENTIEMKVSVDNTTQQFYWRTRGSDQWEEIGPELDASVISDEGGRGEHESFTGAFCGMVVFDLTGSAREASFGHFNYAPKS